MSLGLRPTHKTRVLNRSRRFSLSPATIIQWLTVSFIPDEFSLRVFCVLTQRRVHESFRYTHLLDLYLFNTLNFRLHLHMETE